MIPANKITKIISTLLDMAADEMSNNICTDVGRDIRAILTKEQWKELNVMMHEQNGSFDEHDEYDMSSNYTSLMWYFAKVLKEE